MQNKTNNTFLTYNEDAKHHDRDATKKTSGKVVKCLLVGYRLHSCI